MSGERVHLADSTRLAPSTEHTLPSVNLAFDPFDFYGMAEVRPAETILADRQSERVIAFLLDREDGTSRWLYLVTVDRDAPVEPIQELGNVLASRLADRLAQSEGGAIVPSPPRELAESAGKRLRTRLKLDEPGGLRQAFVYAEKNGNPVLVSVRTYLVPIDRVGGLA